MKFLLFISIVLLTACFGTSNEKLAIDKSRVDYVEIRNRIDTVALPVSEKHLQTLFQKLESSDPRHLGKGLALGNSIRKKKKSTV